VRRLFHRGWSVVKDRLRSRLRVVASESGVALGITLAFVLLTVLITATLVALVINEYQTAGVAEQSRQAIQIADAAVERAIFELKRDADWIDTAEATSAHPSSASDITTWYVLDLDPSPLAFKPMQAFPTDAPVGQVTVELRNVGSGETPGFLCAPQTCIAIRATSRVGRASKRVEVILQRLSSDLFPVYSNNAVNVGAGGGGNGVFTLHGSFYVARCSTLRVRGRDYCVGLNMQGNGAILNDRPFFGDAAAPPYKNRVYVHGYIAGQGNSWTIGTSPAPMWAVASAGILPAGENQVFALQRHTDVPVIPFPDPSVEISQAASLRVNSMTAYTCPNSGGCTQGQWVAVPLDDARRDLLLQSNSKVVIPDAGGRACTANPQAANACNSAGAGNVAGTGNFTMVFDGFAGAGVPNLFVQDGAYIHTLARVLITTDVRYRGRATFLVECLATGQRTCANTDSLEIRASVTPLCRMSSTTCTPTFQTGDALAFFVGPNNPGAALTTRGVYVRGANIELNMVIKSHNMLKNDNPQRWYGMFLAGQLDFDNNPEIFAVNFPDRDHCPPGACTDTQRFALVRVLRWQEVF